MTSLYDACIAVMFHQELEKVFNLIGKEKIADAAIGDFNLYVHHRPTPSKDVSTSHQEMRQYSDASRARVLPDFTYNSSHELDQFSNMHYKTHKHGYDAVIVPASNTTIEVDIVPVSDEVATLEGFAKALLENNLLDGGMRVRAWNKRHADHHLVVIMWL